MNVYLCGRTALDVYFLAKERLGLSFYSRLERVEVGSLWECAHTARQVAGCELGFLAPLHTGRIDVLVPSANLCNASAAVQPHVWSGELPAGAFAKLSDGVYLATPEFLALMMARTLDRYQTLQLCMQLCGIYANSRTAKHGMVQHPRLASEERMRAMAADPHGSGRDGRQRFVWATQHVMGGAASHVEAGVALLHAMPWQSGGYALRRFELNARVDYNEKNRASTGAEYCLVDMLDRATKFGWEYQGHESHSDVEGAEPYQRRDRTPGRGGVVATANVVPAANAASAPNAASAANAAVAMGAPSSSIPAASGSNAPLAPSGSADSSGPAASVTPVINMSYGAKRLNEDVLKLAALADQRYDVRPLVWDQVSTVHEFDRVARVTAEKFGVDVTKRHAFANDQEVMRRRLALHRGLLLDRFYWEDL